MRCDKVEQAIGTFHEIMKLMELDNPVSQNEKEDLKILSTSVNSVRLKNNPVALDEETIRCLYDKIIK